MGLAGYWLGASVKVSKFVLYELATKRPKSFMPTKLFTFFTKNSIGEKALGLHILGFY